MKLSEFSSYLQKLDEILFQLPDGSLVPKHFHITEIGKIQKDFIDCGGSLRHENKISFQLFSAGDHHHRLRPKKLTHIIELAQEKLQLPDAEIEVEYQGESILKYQLHFDGRRFLLVHTQTDCLAKDKCGIPTEKPRVKLSQLGATTCCIPNGNCC
ncbi:hypothetical protein C7S20_18210 [Christiangramia fulva]|uniref:Uncharacterized protein n=1 Tax=Christiangramia fulva TaxID=2126553 RepID=A0A2R3Z9S5_9FLAO|nr:DUF6428 family protein [Christiangramia fulva]AVR47026.1 hypothetical protein C7S20_18210 [Christiangramia fulva]